MPAAFKYPAEPPRPAKRPEPPILGQLSKDLPKNSLWLTHDPAIYHDKASGDYFMYCTEGIALRSHDMIAWERLGKIVEISDDAKKWTDSDAIWAPDIVKVGDEYRLYCSNSSFGRQQSCIFLAVSDTAEGPFTPKQIVLRSSERSGVNAIDANIIEDVNNGKQYMVYGSFWSGCHIVELDKNTGLALNGPDDIGICLARRPLWTDAAIEGPYIVYNPDTEYYYLFVSYGSLKSDYNIRVGRSKSVTGPYLDHNGIDMTDLDDDDNSLGYMLACGYKFDDDNIGYMAPGHNSVLHDFDGEWYLVSHIRLHNFRIGELPVTHIRKMLWTDDGWPVASPEVYSGEKLQPVTKDLICGSYEKIVLQPAIPQGMQTSVRMRLDNTGTGLLADSIHIKWELSDEYTLQVLYANTVENLKVLAAWDYEAWKPTIVLTGTNDKHICIWGKKYA